MNSFSVEQKRVDVFESAAPNKPVIYLNAGSPFALLLLL